MPLTLLLLIAYCHIKSIINIEGKCSPPSPGAPPQTQNRFYLPSPALCFTFRDLVSAFPLVVSSCDLILFFISVEYFTFLFYKYITKYVG